MKKNDLWDRTQNFALRVINMAGSLPGTKAASVIAGQILRSATSVAANYRIIHRSKSSRDFINKLKIVEEETDETIFWLELIVKSKIIRAEKIQPLMDEANELLAIFVASLKTMKAKSKGTS